MAVTIKNIRRGGERLTLQTVNGVMITLGSGEEMSLSDDQVQLRERELAYMADHNMISISKSSVTKKAKKKATRKRAVVNESTSNTIVDNEE